MEIYRQEAPEFRSVCLTVGPDGSVRMYAQDMGDFVEKMWDDDDYKFWSMFQPKCFLSSCSLICAIDTLVDQMRWMLCLVLAFAMPIAALRARPHESVFVFARLYPGIFAGFYMVATKIPSHGRSSKTYENWSSDRNLAQTFSESKIRCRPPSLLRVQPVNRRRAP
jgi:hypothetical protein